MMYIWCPPFLIGRCAPLANVLVRPPMGLGVSAPHFPQALLETMRTGIAIMELWNKTKNKAEQPRPAAAPLLTS